VAIRPLVVAVRQVAAAVGVAVGVFVVSYLPFGTAGPGMVGDMLDTQRTHAEVGHFTVVGGKVWGKEPWWANMAFWVHGQGWLLVGALLVGGVAAWWARDRLGTAYLWAAVLAPMLFLSSSPVSLAHYWVAWFPALSLLAGIGVVTLLSHAGPSRVLGAGVALVLALSALSAMLHVATLPKGDYWRMADAVEAEAGTPASVVVLGTDVSVYFPGARSTFAGFAPPQFDVDLVVIERQFAEQASVPDLAKLRDRARALGLTPHIIGDVEYWDRPR